MRSLHRPKRMAFIPSMAVLKASFETQISDNGPAIPDNVKEKIFQPFFTTKPAIQGTGLGLAIICDVVKSHGGETTMDPVVGVEAKFIIQRPFFELKIVEIIRSKWYITNWLYLST